MRFYIFTVYSLYNCIYIIIRGKKINSFSEPKIVEFVYLVRFSKFKHQFFIRNLHAKQLFFVGTLISILKPFDAILRITSSLWCWWARIFHQDIFVNFSFFLCLGIFNHIAISIFFAHGTPIPEKFVDPGEHAEVLELDAAVVKAMRDDAFPHRV